MGVARMVSVQTPNVLILNVQTAHVPTFNFDDDVDLVWKREQISSTLLFTTIEIVFIL
jgi:hypothetical protein